MIRGFVNYSEREAVLSLRIRGPGGQEAEVEAVIDTGFNGSLMLPTTLVERLALPFVGSASAALANGDQVFLDVFQATIFWHGQEHDSAVVAAEGGVLVGMSLLAGHRVVIEVEEGGIVLIEPLPDR